MKTIEVVAAIIVRDGKILATRRGYGDFINMWEFPGGKMEGFSDAISLSQLKVPRGCITKSAPWSVKCALRPSRFYHLDIPPYLTYNF